jgi:hypothetical protein
MVAVLYTIESLCLECDPERVPASRQDTLNRALSDALGASRRVRPLRKRAYTRRMREIQETITAVRSRLSQLPPECLFVTISGCVADSRRDLKRQKRKQLAKITEIAITRYEAP